jgi:arginyl-tRNA synthetase
MIARPLRMICAAPSARNSRARVAAAFHALWNVGNDRPDRRFLIVDDAATTRARLFLADGAAQIIRNGLAIMGVEAVTEMNG